MRLLVSLLVILLLPTPLRADTPAHPSVRTGTLSLRLRGVEVKYHRGDAGLARQAGLAAQQAAARIAAELGTPLPMPVTVRLARGRREFLACSGGALPGWALAAALPGRGGIVVDAALVTPATANDLHLVIAHEMVHLALAQYERGRTERLPLWFHEGVATWLSGQRHVRTSRSVFTLAAVQGSLLQFDTLEQCFPEDRAEADLAYLQSEAFIAHIVRTRSPEALRWILDSYRQGESFDKAFQSALGVSRQETERRWAQRYRRRFPWLRILWEITTLFGVLAILTILTFLIVRGRARRQHRQWEQEEQMWTVVHDEEEREEPDESDDDLFT